MGIFDGILGGQGGLTTTTTNTTNPAQQAGGFIAVNPSQLQNVGITSIHNGLMNNPQTWAQSALTPYGETMELKKEVAELRYILQRTVENYEELQTQHKALLDITEAERNTR
jgi:hypothetical protein